MLTARESSSVQQGLRLTQVPRVRTLVSSPPRGRVKALSRRIETAQSRPGRPSACKDLAAAVQQEGEDKLVESAQALYASALNGEGEGLAATLGKSFGTLARAAADGTLHHKAAEPDTPEPGAALDEAMLSQSQGRAAAGLPGAGVELAAGARPVAGGRRVKDLIARFEQGGKAQDEPEAMKEAKPAAAKVEAPALAAAKVEAKPAAAVVQLAGAKAVATPKNGAAAAPAEVVRVQVHASAEQSAEQGPGVRPPATPAAPAPATPAAPGVGAAAAATPPAAGGGSGGGKPNGRATSRFAPSSASRAQQPPQQPQPQPQPQQPRASNPAARKRLDPALLSKMAEGSTWAVLGLYNAAKEKDQRASPPQEAATAAQPSQPSEPQPVATPPTSTAAGASAPASRGRRSRVQNLVAQFEEGRQAEARSSSAPPVAASSRRPAVHMGSFLADKGAAGPALAVLGVCAAAVDALAPLFKAEVSAPPSRSPRTPAVQPKPSAQPSPASSSSSSSSSRKECMGSWLAERGAEGPAIAFIAMCIAGVEVLAPIFVGGRRKPSDKGPPPPPPGQGGPGPAVPPPGSEDSAHSGAAPPSPLRATAWAPREKDGLSLLLSPAIPILFAAHKDEEESKAVHKEAEARPKASPQHSPLRRSISAPAVADEAQGHLGSYLACRGPEGPALVLMSFSAVLADLLAPLWGKSLVTSGLSRSTSSWDWLSMVLALWAPLLAKHKDESLVSESAGSAGSRSGVAGALLKGRVAGTLLELASWVARWLGLLFWTTVAVLEGIMRAAGNLAHGTL